MSHLKKIRTIGRTGKMRKILPSDRKSGKNSYYKKKCGKAGSYAVPGQIIRRIIRFHVKS